jgi:hypothetical protein
MENPLVNGAWIYFSKASKWDPMTTHFQRVHRSHPEKMAVISLIARISRSTTPSPNAGVQMVWAQLGLVGCWQTDLWLAFGHGEPRKQMSHDVP